MKKIKYAIKEVDLKYIKSNRILAVNSNEEDTLFLENNIRQHGLLTNIVLFENKEGENIVVSGELEIQALRNMGITRTDAIISELKNKEDIGKITLLMSGMRNRLQPITEGILLMEMLEVADLTQKELAFKLKKSQGWISKRLSLANKLKDTVIEMVLSKKICARSAEEIAKLPQDKQHEFAISSVSSKLSKSSIEKLVLAYHKESTSESLRSEIIKNPLQALLCLSDNVEFKKLKKDKKDTQRLDFILRFFIKLVSEIEVNIANLSNETICKYSALFIATQNACDNLFLVLKKISEVYLKNSLGNN